MYTIIGGGIGGLALAAGLEKAGVSYHVYERAPELNEVGAGIWLAPNALRVIEEIGLLDRIRLVGNSIDRVSLMDANLNTISDSDQRPFVKEFGYTTVAIHRASLQQMLFECIPRDKITLGATFSHQEPEGERVRIHFRDHPSVLTEYLVGADGIRSAVRQGLFPKAEVRYAGQSCWRGVAEIDPPDEFLHRGVECWGGDIRFGFSRISAGKTYWFAVVRTAEGGKDAPGDRKDMLLGRYADFHPLIGKIIDATPGSAIMRNDIHDLKPLRRWWSERTVLMGDAAHATTPNMGQGGAQSLEDAYVLARLLRGEGGEAVFQRFEDLRRKKVAKVVNRSWSVGQMAHWNRGKRLRNWLMRRVPERIMEDQLRELYRVSEIN